MKHAWTRAAELAAQTPPERNRAADLLRALSIAVVVFGHWLMAAPYVDAEGTAHSEHVLAFAPWTHWLTWGLQVMPVFFFVGGYSNAISWDSARRKGRPFGEWLRGRAERLLAPVLPVVAVWAVLGAVGQAAGVPAGMVRVASITALVPTWFLAVYLLVVPLVPFARAAWERFGMASVVAPAVAAALVDVGYFRFELHGPGWVNYLLVWLAVHQLGFAWRAGAVSRGAALGWIVGGFGALVAMTELGPWPRSLVGVPGEEFSNTTPPHLPVLALAAGQFGLVRALEPAMNRVLAGKRAWTATVLVNGLIMTIFLWHSTVMMLGFGVSLWVLGDLGLTATPGSGAWWLWKGPWIAAFSGVLLALVGPLARLERVPRREEGAPAVWRTIAGCLLATAGLAQLTLNGVGGEGVLGLAWVPLLLPWAGAEVAGLGPLARLAAR